MWLVLDRKSQTWQHPTYDVLGRRRKQGPNMVFGGPQSFILDRANLNKHIVDEGHLGGFCPAACVFARRLRPLRLSGHLEPS